MQLITQDNPVTFNIHGRSVLYSHNIGGCGRPDCLHGVCVKVSDRFGRTRFRVDATDMVRYSAHDEIMHARSVGHTGVDAAGRSFTDAETLRVSDPVAALRQYLRVFEILDDTSPFCLAVADLILSAEPSGVRSERLIERYNGSMLSA